MCIYYSIIWLVEQTQAQTEITLTILVNVSTIYIGSLNVNHVSKCTLEEVRPTSDIQGLSS